MATKKKEAGAEEQIELGSFTCESNNREDGETRFLEGESQSAFIDRRKGSHSQFERGASYRLYAVLEEDAPARETITMEVPADEVGTLPKSARAKNGSTKVEESR